MNISGCILINNGLTNVLKTRCTNKTSLLVRGRVYQEYNWSIFFHIEKGILTKVPRQGIIWHVEFDRWYFYYSAILILPLSFYKVEITNLYPKMTFLQNRIPPIHHGPSHYWSQKLSQPLFCWWDHICHECYFLWNVKKKCPQVQLERKILPCEVFT